MRQFTYWRWHLDEVYVKIDGEMRYVAAGRSIEAVSDAWKATVPARRLTAIHKCPLKGRRGSEIVVVRRPPRASRFRQERNLSSRGDPARERIMPAITEPDLGGERLGWESGQKAPASPEGGVYGPNYSGATTRRGQIAMSVREQIERYISDQSPAKREELRDLHRRVLEISPDAKIWFLDGRNDDGNVVSAIHGSTG